MTNINLFVVAFFAGIALCGWLIALSVEDDLEETTGENAFLKSEIKRLEGELKKRPGEWHEMKTISILYAGNEPVEVFTDLPENGQEVLIHTGRALYLDTFTVDENGGRFEDFNVEKIAAWMEVPALPADIAERYEKRAKA